MLDELQEVVDNPDETDDLLRLGLHRLPIGEFPLLRSLAPVLANYDGAAELERGLDILLTGLTAALTPQPRSVRTLGQHAHGGTGRKPKMPQAAGPASSAGPAACGLVIAGRGGPAGMAATS